MLIFHVDIMTWNNIGWCRICSYITCWQWFCNWIYMYTNDVCKYEYIEECIPDSMSDKSDWSIISNTESTWVWLDTNTDQYA